MAEEWAALTARFSGVPHNPVKAFYRKWKHSRAVDTAKQKAERQASDIITAFDYMAD